MDRRIEPGALNGRVEAIASKSELHRLILCASLADAPVTLLFHSGSEDVEATLDCAAALGAKIERREDGVRITPISCHENNSGIPVLRCRESGSTLRFVLPLVAALGRGGRFTGEGRLAERPLGELMTALERGGVRFSASKLPFEMTGRARPGRYALPGNVSSQYVTGLLMALPLLDGESEIVLETALESASYVDVPPPGWPPGGSGTVPRLRGGRGPGLQSLPHGLSAAGGGTGAAPKRTDIPSGTRFFEAQPQGLASVAVGRFGEDVRGAETDV